MGASAPVTGLDLALDNARMAALYLGLAARHDALVQWVNDRVLHLETN